VSTYITMRLTVSQIEAAENATDLIAETYRADGNRREANRYAAASRRLTKALQAHARSKAHL
jgi:hypothetical protein